MAVPSRRRVRKMHSVSAELRRTGSPRNRPDVVLYPRPSNLSIEPLSGSQEESLAVLSSDPTID